GTLNDVATLFQFLCTLPLTVVLDRLATPDRRRLSRISMAIGVVGLLGVVIAQVLLVTRVLDFAVNLPLVMAAFGLFGIWMFQANSFARESGGLSSRLARLGKATGVAFILMSAIILLIELINWRDPSALARLAAFAQQDLLLIRVAIILAIVVFLVLFIAFFLAVPLWLIGLGRRLFAIARASEPVPGESLVYSGT
ncbi:MAG TPA: hypothetical protein VFU63_10485, partial [Ktedonobacterales bacterium]|nr:hypothetical protein [Ktedonobacterales bacterium]